MVVYLDKTALPDPQPRSLVESPNTTCDIGGGCGGGGNGGEEERNGAFASGEASLRTFDSNNVTFEPPSEHTLYGEQQQQTKEGAPLQMMCASRLLDGSPTVEFFSERVSSLNDEEEEREEVVETSSSLTETAKTAKVQGSKIQKSEREKNDEATNVLSADANNVESANVLVGPTQQKNEMDDTKVDDNEEATAICSLSKYVQTTNSPSRPESAQSDATEIDIAEFFGEEEENGGMAENDEAMEAEKVCQTDRKRSKVRALQKKFRRPPRDSDEEDSESESDGFGKHSTDIATEWAVRKAKGKNCKRGMPGGSGDAGAAQRRKEERIKRRKERIQQHNRRLQLNKGSQSHWAEELTTPALDLVQGIPASVPAAAAQVASVKPSVSGRDAAEDSDEVVLLPSPAPPPKRRPRRGGKKRKRNARRKSTAAATTPTPINPVKSTAEYSYKIDNTKFIDKPGLRAMGYGVVWDENSYVELLSIEDCMPCSLEDIRDLHLDHHLKGLPAYEEEKAQIKAKKAEESGGEEKVVKEEEEKAVVMSRITRRQLKNLHKDYERRVGPSKDGLTVVRLLAVITGRHRFTHKMKVLVEWDDYSTALVDLGDLAKRTLPLPHLFQEQLAKVLLTEHNYLEANHRWPVLLQSELNGPRGLNEVVLPLLKAIVKQAKALKALDQTIDGALKEGIYSVFTTTAWMEFTQERHFFGGPSAAAAAKGSLKRSGRSKASTSAVPATEPYQVYLAPGTHRREDVTMRLDELERLPLHLCKSCHRFFVASDVDLLLHLLKEDDHEGFVLPPTPRDQEEVERLKAVYGKVVKLWNQAEAAAEVVKEMAATPLENGKSASKRKLQASKKETEEEKVSQKLKKLKLHNYDDDEE